MALIPPAAACLIRLFLGLAAACPIFGGMNEVTLPADLERFAEEAVASGRYRDRVRARRRRGEPAAAPGAGARRIRGLARGCRGGGRTRGLAQPRRRAWPRRTRSSPRSATLPLTGPRSAGTARREFVRALREIAATPCAADGLNDGSSSGRPADWRATAARASPSRRSPDARYRFWSVAGFPYLIVYRPDTSPALDRPVRPHRAGFAAVAGRSARAARTLAAAGQTASARARRQAVGALILNRLFRRLPCPRPVFDRHRPAFRMPRFALSYGANYGKWPSAAV